MIGQDFKNCFKLLKDDINQCKAIPAHFRDLKFVNNFVSVEELVKELPEKQGYY